jgi:hypothetical protein
MRSKMPGSFVAPDYPAVKQVAAFRRAHAERGPSTLIDRVIAFLRGRSRRPRRRRPLYVAAGQAWAA